MLRRRHRRISLLLVANALVVISTAGAGNPPGQNPPVLSKLPSIAGSAVEEQLLTADPGTWKGRVKAYSFQWARCDSSGAACSAISGASTARYTETAADVGKTLRVVVVATNKNGSAAATSAPTAVVAAATATPPPPPPPPPPAPPP